MLIVDVVALCVCEQAHEEMHRPHHRSVLVQLAQQSSASASVSMELFAVLCKGLFGYVAYVRLPQSSPDAQPNWVFFNPMDHSEGEFSFNCSLFIVHFSLFTEYPGVFSNRSCV